MTLFILTLNFLIFEVGNDHCYFTGGYEDLGRLYIKMILHSAWHIDDLGISIPFHFHLFYSVLPYPYNEMSLMFITLTKYLWLSGLVALKL